MSKRKRERIALILSIAMLLSSTGIMSSLAVDAGESSSAPSTSVSESSTSSTSTAISQEGGTLSTAVANEGGAITVPANGDGSVENPYLISNASEFINIKSKLNNKASANKYFKLDADIDLSGVTAEQFDKNAGSLITMSRKLSAESSNIFINLDGAGHKIYGLDVNLNSGYMSALFGYLSAGSVIKNLTVSNCKITAPTTGTYAAILVALNAGTISNVSIQYPTLTAESSKYTGLVAAVNSGTITNTTVRSNQTNAGAANTSVYTIKAVGTVGGIVGSNGGKVVSSSAINIGEFIPETKGVVTYGGIAGISSGKISYSVSTGNVVGGKSSDIAGGIVGKADAKNTLDNDYTLISFAGPMWACGVIGSCGTADMIKDCYWSSVISGRKQMCTDYGTGINEITGLTYKVIKAGTTEKVAASSINNKWGKANFAINGTFSTSSSGITVTSDATTATVKGVAADSLSYLKYDVEIKLPANVGASASQITLSQHMRIPVIVVPETTVGNGTAASPLEISNGVEFAMLSSLPNIYCKLANNLTLSKTIASFCGTLDGAGHTITTSTQLITNTYGTIKNLSVLTTGIQNNAIFGRSINANLSNVSVSCAKDSAFEFSTTDKGAFFNNIAGKSVIDNCRANVNVNITADTAANIGGFAGTVTGEATIKNSGAHAIIKSASTKVIPSVAGFIGALNANATITNCYTSGTNTAGAYSFIGSVSADKPVVKSIWMSKGSYGDVAEKALDFTKYEKIIPSSEFKSWSFDDGASGFFTGTDGSFNATLPSVYAVSSAAATGFTATSDTTKLNANVTVENGKAVLHVSRAAGVITVKNSIVSLTNNATGLTAYIGVSNGLEKDSSGNYIITNGFDLTFVGENLAYYKTASFVVSNDIDMSDIPNFTSIGGTSVGFAGTFNGNGHTISNLSINGTSKSGLFSTLNGATVKNIIFDNAAITAEGKYTGVLAGQVIGATTISDITVKNSKVNTNGTYSALLVGSVNADDVQINNITISDSSIDTTASYAGALAGRITGKTTVSNIEVSGFTANGAGYIAGAVGIATGDDAVSIGNVSITGSKIAGVDLVAGVVGRSEKNTAINNATVTSSSISAINTTTGTAGGIAAVCAGLINNANVSKTTVSAGNVGGIVGKSIENCTLEINNSQVTGTTITASDEHTSAAGILGTHRVDGSVVVSGCKVSEDTTISGAALTSGIVADFSGTGTLSISGCTSKATVTGSDTANATAAAGVIGRIGSSAINSITISNTTVSGKISGTGALGGIIGCVKDIEVFDSATPIISNCVAAPQITVSAQTLNKNSGLIIGSVEKNKSITNDNIASVVKDTVISTYFGSVGAYGESTGLTLGGFYDMDKPNGKAITASPDTLEDSKETTVSISNLPSAAGFTFDAATGWASESDERIAVVSSTANSAVLKANYKADISIVAYYTLNSDTSFRVPVHFRVVSKIRTPLNGLGTQESPYLISSAFELEALSEYASDGAYFALTQDIIFTQADFEFGGAFYNVGNGIITIGNAEAGFNGTFTGLHNSVVHKISGLKLSGNNFGGLFGATDGATISDLIIENADVIGLNYAGVIIGSAKDTTLRNITINKSSVTTTQPGSLAGAVIGYAENTQIENITVDGAKVSTTLDATSATVEVAGGIVGLFSGSISDISLKDISVTAGNIAGGVVGEVRGTEDVVSIKNAVITADVTAPIAGGILGRAVNPLGITISGCNIGGTVTGETYAAGVIAQITADSSQYSIENLKAPLVSDTVIATTIAKADTTGTIIGKVSLKVFEDKEIENTDVFSDVFVSSYQNTYNAFGIGGMDAYQTGEYVVNDLSNVKFNNSGYISNKIPLSTETTVLADDSIVIDSASGTYKSLTAGNHTMSLKGISSDIDGLVTYDGGNSSVKLNKIADDGAKLVFTYDNGLEIAGEISNASDLEGNGTVDDPYRVSDAQDFILMAQNNDENTYFVLTADISLAGVSQFDSFAGNLDGKGNTLYDYTGASLFKEVSGKISNTGFAGFSVSDSSSAAVGAVAGIIDAGVIENCFVIADVSASGTNQDAGIIAGRMINGGLVSGCLTSGRVAGKTLTSGGIVGAALNSSINSSVSTAYVSGAKTAGGIVGDAEYANISSVIFANMVDSANVSGNIAGKVDAESKIENSYMDSQTAKTEKAAGNGSADATSLKTQDINELSIDGFTKTAGYPVPSALASKDVSAKFATGVAFAAMNIRYLSGLNSGTVFNYTQIKADDTANGNAVSLDINGSELTLTLMTNADYTGVNNAVERYASPAAVSAVNVSYNINDSTSDASLGNRLLAVTLKSRAGDVSNAFDLFTTAASQAKSINSVAVTDNTLYAGLVLPKNYTYTVSAVDENGRTLKVESAANEGFMVVTGSATTVSITFTVSDIGSDSDWGVRSIWGSIGQ